MMRRILLTIIAGLMPGGVYAAQDAALAMRPITAEYEVYVGGLHLLHAEAHADLDAGTYRLAGRAQTIGIWSKWLPWEMSVASIGKTTDGKVAPLHYRTVSAWKRNPKLLLMDYRKDGAVTIAAESTDAPSPEEQLGKDVVDKTLDPLSGILQLLAHYTLRNDCNASAAVFDGRRRFDLAAHDLGAVEIPANPDTGIFSGAARKCALRFDLIAGKAKGMESRRFWRGDKGKSGRAPFTVWLGRLRPDMPPVPVRAETSSPFGLVMIYLASWRFKDAPVAPELVARAAGLKTLR